MESTTSDEIILQPLPKQNRRATFILLTLLFLLSLPVLYLYATGYRFELGERANLISTGGIYVAAERTGAEIFIDDELVRETRAFRRAFYAQSLEPGTHRVHVQKEGHHTWVKELPVTPHIVTEAQAFNIPLVPQVRIISPWLSATGSAVVSEFALPASSTNEYIATSTEDAKTFIKNSEYEVLIELFATSSATATEPRALTSRALRGIDTLLVATTTATGTEEIATTTKEWRGVRLYESGDDLFAKWIGSQEDMPYYYCAEDFEPYRSGSSSTPELPSFLRQRNEALLQNSTKEEDEMVFMHPVQTVSEDIGCEPIIQIHTQFQDVRAFDFFPGSTDFVILALEDGIYVIEVDDRAWQNVQPLLLGEGLNVRVVNGQIYVYDGELIYQVIVGL